MNTYDVKITRVSNTRDRLHIELYSPAADSVMHENEIPLASMLIPEPMPHEYSKPTVYWVNTGEPDSLNLGADVGYVLNRLTDLIAEVK